MSMYTFIKTIQRRWLPAWFAMLAVASAAQAHHSFAMFDQNQRKSIDGTVRTFEFTFPHSWLWVDVPDGKGGAVTWGFEGAGPAELNRLGGWTHTSVRRGDKITVNYCPLRSGKTGGAFTSVKLADGRVLKGFELACVPKQPQ
jgi:hypothetical protein